MDSFTVLEEKGGGEMFRRIILVLMVVYTLYHVVFALDVLPMLGSGLLSVTQHLGIHLAGILFFTFLLVPAKKSIPKGKPQWYDILLAFAALVPTIHYAIWGEERMLFYSGLSLPRDAVMSWLTILLCIEATRRAVSPIFATLVGIFAIYPMIAAYTPSIFHSSSVSFMREGEFLYIATDGMFGVPVWTSATLLFVFILFSQAMIKIGMGEFINNFATSLFGQVRGGPAKVEVVSSALFGMVSGSAVANVVATGSFTIPMMKSLGYKPHIAAAIEACSSTGGQYMPPVMGSAIFVMCAWINVPYREVIVIAAIPALLYFWAIFIMVDLEAAKTGLMGLPRDRLPSFTKTIKQGWWYSIPISAFIYALTIVKFSAQKSGLYSIFCALFLSLLRRDTRPTLKALVEVCEETIQTMTMIGTACLAAGIMIGCVSLTGFAVRLSEGIVLLSGNNLYLLLLLGAASSMILGMGLPSIPCYIFLALMLAPALVKCGVPTIAAHLFLFYYGVVSFITPPVAMAAYAAAGIAGCSPMKTGYTCMRLGMGAYIIPFAFCTMPAVLLIGSPAEIALAIISLTMGISAIAVGFEGYLFSAISWLERIPLFAAGVMLIADIWMIKLIGLIIIIMFVMVQLVRWRNNRRGLPVTSSLERGFGGKVI